MTIDVENIIASKLKELASNKDFCDFPTNFIYPSNIEKNSILFLGLNPSSTNELFAPYTLLQESNTHPYFRKFEEIGRECGTKWSHLDLLYFQETDQSKTVQILKSSTGVNYIWQQLIITDSLIKQAEPLIIVVCNTLSRTFLGFGNKHESKEWLKYNFDFDNVIGTYRWKGIPVFFSGMLTGQRALDVGSYERLKWQIKRTIQIVQEDQCKKG